MDRQQTHHRSSEDGHATTHIRRLEVLNRVGKAITADHKLESIVQIVTDAATELSGAQFGAFFYNVLNERGESYLLYTLSGAPRSAFEKFGMPRNTAVFDHTFRGIGVVRSDDIRTDPKYGLSAPHFGMPAGHLPVTSYLAVPVISRTGEILGGLFFGHQKPGVFAQSDEEIILDIAAQASVAIDNARLLEAAQRLASIVESSDDAIISKDLNGTIRSWNNGAERIFGYTAKEAIGQPITILIPDELRDHEPAILDRIIRGERIDHYETLRQRKDGSRVNISLTVSPIRDASGTITGASKVARDISDTKNAQENERLLLREMSHRVKNLFAVASGVVALSARSVASAPDLAHAVQQRLAALARAHDLTLPVGADGGAIRRADLSELVKTVLAPYDSVSERRFEVSGPKIECGPGASTSFALMLHEFATNSIKYGALSVPDGNITVQWDIDGELDLRWTEHGGPAGKPNVESQGFGGVLVGSTVKGLGGTIDRSWLGDGLTIRVKVPLSRLNV